MGKNKFKLVRETEKLAKNLPVGRPEDIPGQPASSNRREQAGRRAAVTVKLPFEVAIQPIKAKYGGMGFAKKSIFLNIQDSEFDSKFQEVFREHIQGWAGNSYAKSRKKQEQSQMLWKQRLNAKNSLEPLMSLDGIFMSFQTTNKQTKKLNKIVKHRL